MRPIQAVSAEGERAVAKAAELAAGYRLGASDRDRAGYFDPQPIQAAIDCGLGAATIAVARGGGGVRHPSDLMAVAATLARGDGSAALAINMHLGSVRGLGAVEGSPLVSDFLDGVTAGRTWLSAAVSEVGTNFFNPRSTLRRRPGGWTLNGDKIFATGSPMATHLITNVAVIGGEHDGHLATALVATDQPGVEIIDDWDAMGMRASGSGRVRFADVDIDAGDCLVIPAGPVGAFSAGALVGRSMGNLANLAAMVGLAEEATSIVAQRLGSESRVVASPLASRGTVRQSFGQMQADLYLAQAVLRDLGRRCDDASSLERPLSLVEAHELMAEFQAAKVVTNGATIDVVNRAMELAGGSGYLAGHALSRLYRDVRAGPFMQPFTPHESLGYVASVGLGLEPDPEA